MSRASTAVSRFLKRATPDQARAVAKKAKTSVAHLRHVAAGRRGVTADMAQRLAHATTGVPGDLYLDQRILCDACARCPIALRS
jgi:plasmid maintenance system antidote protein VapI